MKIGSRIPRPAVWLSLVLSMAALLAGCANVAFDHGTTALEENHPSVQEMLKAGHGVISKPYPPVELGLRACMILMR